MSTVTFKARTQIGEKAYEVGEVAALTARLEAYVLERGLATPGGELPGPDVTEVDFPKPPVETVEQEEEQENEQEEDDADDAEDEGVGAPPATGAGDSPATGSQPQPPQAPGRRSTASASAKHRR